MDILTYALLKKQLADKADLIDGIINPAQLPSYIDRVEAYDTFDEFPNPGDGGVIYLDRSTQFTYRWTGEEYLQITTTKVVQNLTNEVAFSLTAEEWIELKERGQFYKQCSIDDIQPLYEFVNVSFKIGNNTHYVKLAKNSDYNYAGMSFIKDGATNVYQLNCYYDDDHIFLSCLNINNTILETYSEEMLMTVYGSRLITTEA